MPPGPNLTGSWASESSRRCCTATCITTTFLGPTIVAGPLSTPMAWSEMRGTTWDSCCATRGAQTWWAYCHADLTCWLIC